MVGFADDNSVDTDTSGEDPLFGPAFRCVGIFLKHPIQQRAVFLFRCHSEVVPRKGEVRSRNGAVGFSRPGLKWITSNPIFDSAAVTGWNAWPAPVGAGPGIDWRAPDRFSFHSAWCGTFSIYSGYAT